MWKDNVVSIWREGKHMTGHGRKNQELGSWTDRFFGESCLLLRSVDETGG